ncbi:hypothetical protein D3C87_2041410 [compost metagenome]
MVAGRSWAQSVGEERTATVEAVTMKNKCRRFICAFLRRKSGPVVEEVDLAVSTVMRGPDPTATTFEVLEHFHLQIH